MSTITDDGTALGVCNCFRRLSISAEWVFVSEGGVSDTSFRVPVFVGLHVWRVLRITDAMTETWIHTLVVLVLFEACRRELEES